MKSLSSKKPGRVNLRFKNPDASKLYEEKFKNSVVWGNGTVNWDFFDGHWKEVSQVFEVQGWIDLLFDVYTYYPNVVKSVYSNASYCSSYQFHSWYGKHFMMTPSDVNKALKVDGDNLAIIPLENVLDDIDLFHLWEVLTYVDLETINEAKDYPSFEHLKPLAIMVHEIIISAIEAQEERECVTERSLWLLFHLLRREKVSLGHFYVTQLNNCCKEQENIIRNPGWLTETMTCSLSFKSEKWRTESLVDVDVGQSIVDDLFELRNGSWVYIGGVEEEEEDDGEDVPRAPQPSGPREMGEGSGSGAPITLQDLWHEMQNMQQSLSSVVQGLQAISARIEHQDVALRRNFENMDHLYRAFQQEFPSYSMPPFLPFIEPANQCPTYPSEWTQNGNAFGEFITSLLHTRGQYNLGNPSNIPPSSPSLECQDSPFKVTKKAKKRKINVLKKR